MSREEIMELGFEDLETRASEIAVETAEADAETLEKLNAELDTIEERRAILNKEVEEKRKAAEAVAQGAGTEIETRKEEKTMTNKEVRNSHEYIEAFAKYIKTGKDAECRALLTENVEGVVPVPDMVETRIRQAWENDEVFSRVYKTFVRGNLKIGFEISATDAEIHTEGDMEGPAEEVLELGIVTMVPENIKKWVTVSDEVLALGPEEFLTYIYDELAYKIIKKAADLVVAAIQNAPGESEATKVGVAKVDGDVTPETILSAIALLGDNARDNVIIAAGSTIAAVRLAALQASFAYDPFFGLTVIQKDGVEGAIVGDLSGVQANLPEGEAIKYKFDDLSLAEHDMVKIVGRLYAAIAVVGPKMFAVIGGGSASE